MGTYLVTWYFIAPTLSEFSEPHCNIQKHIGHCGVLSVLLVPVDAEMNALNCEQAQRLLGIDRR